MLSDTRPSWAELQANLADVRRDVQARLAPYPDELRRLHAVAAEFFLTRSEGKVYRRRPNLSLTLTLEGSPPAHVAVYPLWDGRARCLKPDHIRADVVVERVGYGGLSRPMPEIALELTEGLARCMQFSRWSTEALQRLLPTAAAFLTDSPAVFARSAVHCCICYKALSNEVSRARGIGPECFKRATSLRRIIERKRAAELAAF
jgi:hypothetical protein